MNSVGRKVITGKIAAFVQLILGVCVLLFFGLVTIGFMVMDEPVDTAGLVVALVMDAIGVLLIFLGCRRQALLKVYKRYSSLLSWQAVFILTKLLYIK